MAVGRHLKAANYLANLWRRGQQSDVFPEELRPANLDEGYDIQDLLIEVLDERVAGWKLGVGSARAKAESGIGRPIAGRVLGCRCFQAGGIVPVPDKSPIAIEFEFAYVLGRDILPDAPPLASPLDAVAEMRVTFELVRSRFFDRRIAGWAGYAADNAGFVALVVGDRIDPAAMDAILKSVVVYADGEARARALTGEDEVQPLSGLTDLIALARERNMPLPRGMIISTGAATKPFPIHGEAEIVAEYPGETVGFRTMIERWTPAL
jgi:2-keto-4-pentenoate hydratase